jgi:hypothetical protein
MSKKTWTNTMSTYFAQGMQYALKYGAWCYTEFELPEVGQRVMIVSQRLDELENTEESNND